MRRSTAIIGSGSSLPTRRLENESFLDHEFFRAGGEPYDRAANRQLLDRFRDITEITERRHAAHDRVASDLGAEAAAAALADARIDPETLDYLVVAHNFGDVAPEHGGLDFCPTLAARIKRSLGIANPSCVAYDLPFGCPGWLQAVVQADYFLRSGDAARALVVGAETLSRVSDPHDRDSLIYSDGAGAVVLEATERDDGAGILTHVTRSDALDHADLLCMGPSYHPSADDEKLYLKMRGRKVYEYAVRTVPGVVKTSLDRAGLTLTDVSKVLMHQANAKLDQAILKHLFRLYDVSEIPPHLMPMTVAWLGNSSVATLPTLFDLVRRGRLEDHAFGPEDVLVFASVGAGMNVNSLVYRHP